MLISMNGPLPTRHAGQIRSSDNGQPSIISRKMNVQPAADNATALWLSKALFMAGCESRLELSVRNAEAFQGHDALVVILAIHRARLIRRGHGGRIHPQTLISTHRRHWLS
jgi:hypothetical protein